MTATGASRSKIPMGAEAPHLLFAVVQIRDKPSREREVVVAEEKAMQQEIMIVAVILIVVGIAVAGWFLWRRHQRKALVRKYGPEYQRIVREKGDPREAEKELEAREERVSHFQLRELGPAERERYLEEWNRIQALFVDQPTTAVTRAHELLMVVMRDRGYPDAELEQRQRDLSVHYPQLIEPYREACEIAAQNPRSSAASTEDLRRATICYRSLFNALLNGTPNTRRKSSKKYEVAS